MTLRPSPPEQADSPPATRSADGGAPGYSPVPAVAVTVVVVLVFLIAAPLWPHAADGLLRLLLATLAIGFVAARASRTIPPFIRDPYSPFDRESGVHSPPAAPAELRKLVRTLEAAAPGRFGKAGEIPGAVRLILRGEVSRLLAERHGLSLDEPAHHDRIRSLLSESTWLLVRPREALTRPGLPAPSGIGSLPLGHLGHILDDLERR